MANGLTYTRKSESSAETKDFAATLAPLLREGDVVILNGDLGAGKTQFVQGVAEALGINELVTSPTFTIMLSYQGDQLTLNHFDLYRLEDPDELDDIGYWEILENGGVSFVEWGDRFPNHAPTDFVEIGITVDAEGMRTVRARAYGERARRLLYIWAQDKEAKLKKIEGY